jgi:hypothetical protein
MSGTNSATLSNERRTESVQVQHVSERRPGPPALLCTGLKSVIATFPHAYGLDNLSKNNPIRSRTSRQAFVSASAVRS